MSDPFAVRELRIRQPARVLPGRARYDIFDSARTLLAVAAETTPRSVLQTMADLVPRTRTIAVRSASGEPVLTLVKRDSDWLVDVTDPDGRLIGRIQIGETRRHYTLLDEAGQVEAFQPVGNPIDGEPASYSIYSLGCGLLFGPARLNVTYEYGLLKYQDVWGGAISLNRDRSNTIVGDVAYEIPW